MEQFEFVVSYYNSPSNLMMCLGSIMSQTANNWKIHVVADGDSGDPKSYQKIINYFDGDTRIQFSRTESRSNDFGYTPRDYAIKRSTSDWIVMTGHDNYYFPVFLEAFNACIDDKTNFIFCDMYHNYSNYEYGKAELRKIVYPNGFVRYEGIDLGCYASRTKFAKQIEIEKTLHWADGKYVADYWTKFCSDDGAIKKINRSFYVHN